MARNNAEDKLQIMVVGYLNAALPRGAVFWHVPNGGPMTGERRAKLAKMGERPGVSDLMIYWRRQLYCIELKLETDPIYKTRRTEQSDEQKDFQRVIEAQGAFYAVCRSLDDVRGSLTGFGVPLRDAEVSPRRGVA